jgi:ribosomal-protein-alanine N-acetyltransferase
MSAQLAASPAHDEPMTLAALDEVVAAEQAAYAFPWSRGNFIDSLAAGYEADLRRDAGSGGLLGYWVAMPGVGELHLLNLTVVPAHQGQGLGQALLERVIQRARDLQLGSLWLEVRPSNERACGLYLRRGFALAGRRRAYYPGPHGTREDALVMHLGIADAQ